MTRLLTSGILFSTAVNAVLVAKPEVLGISLSISVILALHCLFLSASLILFSKIYLSVSHLVFKTNLLVSILFTISTNLSYTVFLTNSLFTTLLSLLKSTGTVFNLSISILSISAYRLAESDFATRLDESTPVAFF